ncbi:hypothetical protein MPTK1_4g19270 [Marchantia polymorpha subsp. ruderalis]|uniref:Uncharacterized protein n=2 Tax=Marchantia polymorpha TaxID=3197 RepID=A0AAF6BBI9_MARPO|nr:hypothetical protein MARPO_0169s0017 [Marchantia polymorpha]BBN09373.1 hypothetical protein Mp_4g19270 [Marchantia polymorpha subsp. ruderalis]PTQ28254.1 hypothetical protein MARPO_0169s0017 [Marchantia polymorpha]PTQ28255.1 hypothetical protein MARPO_0169s0017 [Marchantia polymorpha]PTQ28256.1 hypothetical protein MARPO_0169s0017 [Marchantia polymorpha]|eukprot:PTQ28253.1 hypothetical protein MARPO_0169s0017 [Marchantia polymorpha]
MRKKGAMAGPRGGPSLKKLGLLIAALIAGVLFYQKLSAISLNSLLEPSSNRKHYERLYEGAMDEVADWRQRYDNESAKAEQHRQFLNQVELQAKKLAEEKERLKAQVLKLQEELKRNGALG